MTPDEISLAADLMLPLKRTRAKPDTPETEKLAAIARCPLWNGWTDALETRRDRFTLNILRTRNTTRELEAEWWIKGFLAALQFKRW